MKKLKIIYFKKIISIFLGIILVIIISVSYGLGKERKEVDLIVRTINVEQAAADYPLRLRGIAEELHHDYPKQIGLIGLQELKRDKMADCPFGKYYDNNAKCLASGLASLYGQNSETRISERHWLHAMQESLGIIVDDKWRILDEKTWDIGNNRTLLEVFLEHKTKRYRLRFYNTHLSSNKPVKWYHELWYGYTSSKDQGEQRRSEQASKVIQIVRERAKPGELPPIVVGDFNSGRNFVTGEAEISVQKMEEHFWRPLDNFQKLCTDYTVIDNIYIGKKESFPGSKGCFQLRDWHRVNMHKKTIFVDGHRIRELTDHNPEGFSFDIYS